jgi:sigma-B regulation protein RsbQ
MKSTMKTLYQRNNITVKGQGPETIIFAHGFGCSQQTWNGIAEAFEAGYRVVLFDHVGAGASDLKAYNPEKYSRLDGYADDMVEICNTLNINQAVLVAHSVSCMIGVLAALRHPAIFKKLIFLAPSPYFFNEAGYRGGLEKTDVDGLFQMMDSNYLGWTSIMAPFIMGNPERPELGQALANSFCATDPDIARQFAKVTFYSDFRHLLPLLQVESITLQCREDMLAPEDVGVYIKEHTPHNLLMNLNARGHCPHLSAPAETIEAIKQVL